MVDQIQWWNMPECEKIQLCKVSTQKIEIQILKGTDHKKKKNISFIGNTIEILLYQYTYFTTYEVTYKTKKFPFFFS